MSKQVCLECSFIFPGDLYSTIYVGHIRMKYELLWVFSGCYTLLHARVDESVWVIA